MAERICTKAQKDADWKQKGLLRLPKSHRQGMLAVAAKDYVEGLRCYSEARRLLAAGKRPRDVAILIQQHNEIPILTFNSIKKYAQVYRHFCIPAMETLHVRAAELGASPSAVTKYCLDTLAKGFNEIEQLEEMVNLQSERVRNQVDTEEGLGLPLPGVRLEIETQLKLLNTLIEKKIELGLYSKTPQASSSQVSTSLIANLSPDERKRVAEVGRRIIGIIEAAKSNNPSNSLAVGNGATSIL